MTTSHGSITEMDSDQLGHLYEELKSQRREALRRDAPADAVHTIENELRRVGNQLRRRGL